VLRRVCFASALALAATALAAPFLPSASAQDDPESGRPTAFIGSGNAFGTQTFINTVPPQVISEIVNARSPWVTSDFEAGSTSTANASLFDPGALVTNGASLLCQVASQLCTIPNFPPPYPLTAHATNPLNIDATAAVNGDTISVGPVQTTAGDAHAHAGRDKVTADATIFGNALGSGGASLVHVGHASATNDVEFNGDGTLVSTSIAAVTDVNILGAIHIDSIEARSISTAHPDGTSANDVHLDINGASLLGVPVSIDDKGLALGGPPSGGDLLGSLGQTLSPLLSAFRGSVRSLGTDSTVDSSGASASANGLLIELFPNSDAQLGVSPKFDIVLASAGSHAYAYDASSTSGSSRSPSGSGSGPTGVAGINTGNSGRPGTPSVNVPGTPGTAGNGGSPIEQLVNSLLSGSAADRIKFFYLAWTLSMIACAVGSRLRPVRLDALRTTGGTDVQPQ
jgi:hypothetical protein